MKHYVSDFSVAFFISATLIGTFKLNEAKLTDAGDDDYSASHRAN